MGEGEDLLAAVVEEEEAVAGKCYHLNTMINRLKFEPEIEVKSPLKSYSIRLFWLIVGLGGSLVISKFISSFENILEENVIIASFIPLIVYISDAVGTQMESVIIRAIAKEKNFKFAHFFKVQSFIVVFLALSVASISYIGSYLLYNHGEISLALSISVFAAIMSSLVTGLVIPYMFWRFHQDPAESSGPVGTIIQDGLSIFIYFLAVSLIL